MLHNLRNHNRYYDHQKKQAKLGHDLPDIQGGLQSQDASQLET